MSSQDSVRPETGQPQSGSPWGGGNPAARRPWTVVTAAIIAVVMAVLQLLAAFTYFFMSVSWANRGDNWVSGIPGSGLWDEEIPGYRFLKRDFPDFASVTFFGTAAFVGAVLSGLLIWGAITALRGKTGNTLIAATLAALVVDVILDLIITDTYMYILTHVILAGGILLLLIVRSSRRFFALRRSTPVSNV
jgi:hypothetical protein